MRQAIMALLATATFTNAGLLLPRQSNNTSTLSCEERRTACQSIPGANNALCAAEFANCQNGIYSTVNPVPAPTAGINCDTRRSACQSVPGANNALCAAEFANCQNGIYSTVNPAPISATAVYTTKVVTAYTTVCPEATTFSHGTKTYTATKGQTVTVTDCPCTVSQPVGIDCNARRSACQAVPGANNALCAAEFANCQNGVYSTVNPSPGPVRTTTASSGIDCAARRTTCQSYPGANNALCAAEFANCQNGIYSTRNPVPMSVVTTTAGVAPVPQTSSGQIQSTSTATKSVAQVSTTRTGVVMYTNDASSNKIAGAMMAAGIAAALL